MDPSRFVTLCFLYSGTVLLAQYVFIYRFELGLEGLAQLGVAFSVLGVGLVRLRYSKKEEQKPTTYGISTYGMAILSLVLTAIFLVQLFVL